MRMRAELAVSAPAQDAWAVVGERFGEIGGWASAVTESVMDGPPGPGQVRTSQLRIELMFPADDDAETYFRTRTPARSPATVNEPSRPAPG